ncbi:hypothetical protein ABZ897_31945 [Nonomuraea sp. NPDC046802]|uniref:hypothetical protein n=1 Tax=Nonomuraea sp. NPDC046802 TaxID=3154919 RepID=UPI0033FAC59E
MDGVARLRITLLGAFQVSRGDTVLPVPGARLVRELTRRGRAALGEEAFAAAYGKGWELDGKTAVTVVDPARLRRALGTSP